MKCGFNYNKELESFEYKFRINTVKFKWLVRFSNVSKGYKIWDNVRDCMLTSRSYYYIHQLQNLYYSLTGEELNIDVNTLDTNPYESK